MPIQFTCSNCNTAYTVKDQYAGKRTRCKKCEAVIQIPAPTQDESEQDIQFKSDEPAKIPEKKIEKKQPLKQSPPQIVEEQNQDDLPLDIPPPVFTSPEIVSSSLNESLPLPAQRRPVIQSGNTKAARRTYDDGSADSFANTIVFAFAGLIVVSWIVQYFRLINAGYQPKFWAVLVMSGFSLVSYFLIISPLMLLGIWISSKIFKFSMPGGSYMRAAAIWPTVIILSLIISVLAGSLSGWDRQVMVIASFASLIIFLFIPIWAVNRFFGTGWLEAIVSVILSGIMTIIGGMIGNCLLAGILAGIWAAAGAVSHQLENQNGFALKQNSNQSTPGYVSPSTSTPKDPFDRTMDNLRAEYDRVNALADFPRTSVESIDASVTRLRDDFVQANKKYPDRLELKEFEDRFKKLIDKVADLPSENPSQLLNNPIMAKEDWSLPVAERGNEEISFGDFNLNPPTGGVLTLDSMNTSPDMIKWEFADSRNSITFSLKYSGDEKQFLPWIVPPFILDKYKGDVFAITAPVNAREQYGLINSIFFTKITTDVIPENSITKPGIIYVTGGGKKWLVATIASENGSTSEFSRLENIIRSIRKRPPTDMVKPVCSTTYILERFIGEKGWNEAKLLEKLKARSDAEDVVLGAYGIEQDKGKKSRIEAAIVSVATEKSLPVLWSMAKSSGSAEIRTMLKKLDPKHADDISFALLDLSNKDTFGAHSKAIELLGKAAFDPQRNSEICAVMSQKLDEQWFYFYQANNNLSDCLIKWHNDEIYRKLSTVLDSEKEKDGRKIALRVLGASGDKKYAYQLCRWIISEQDEAVKALIALGAPAEIDVGKLLTEKNMNARRNAARVLEQIGSAKSIPLLQAAVSSTKDAEAKEAAKQAIIAIRDRVKASTQPVAK